MADTVLIPLPQAARLLCVSWPRAYDLVLRGRLVGEFRAGRWYVNQESLLELAEALADAHDSAQCQGGSDSARVEASSAGEQHQ